MGRKLPPFTALRAFEATARHLSMKDAAEELHIVPSAVSHQIRQLEQYLDTRLFIRTGNRLDLTFTGRSYARHLTNLLDGLDNATRQAGARRGQTLRVLSTPGFAARWMVPRLSRFSDPQAIRLRVSTGAPDTDFDRNDADVVIQWEAEPGPGRIVEPLMASARYPVISPDLASSAGIERPEDLARLTLMHDEVLDAWPEWFARAGVRPTPTMPRGPCFSNCELSTTAAERGQGVALAYDSVVRDTLASGTLIRLFDTVTLPFVIYSVTYPEHRARDPLLRQFRDWLFGEVARDGTRAATPEMMHG